jgi:hypothetical protein
MSDMVVTSSWKYTDRVPPTRRDALARFVSFDELMSAAVGDATNIRAVARRGGARGLKQTIQPIFYVDFPLTGDALHNGPHGYRAQYLLSPWVGLAANSRLIEALTPKLMNSIDLDAEPDLCKVNVCSSLGASSAKIWVREGTTLLDNVEDLAVPSWVVEAKRGVELATWGLQAPIAERFEVKGALLTEEGHEVVPTFKVRRHFQIHQFGYS